MKPYQRLTLVTIWLAAAVAGAAAAEPAADGKPVAPAQMRRGVLEAVRGEGKMGGPETITNETMEQVARHWIQLRAKTSRTIPPLRAVVPVPADRGPSGPPSEVDTDRGLPDFLFHVNATPSSAVPAGFSSVVNEPSVVARGDAKAAPTTSSSAASRAAVRTPSSPTASSRGT